MSNRNRILLVTVVLTAFCAAVSRAPSEAISNTADHTRGGDASSAAMPAAPVRSEDTSERNKCGATVGKYTDANARAPEPDVLRSGSLEEPPTNDDSNTARHATLGCVTGVGGC